MNTRVASKGFVLTLLLLWVGVLNYPGQTQAAAAQTTELRLISTTSASVDKHIEAVIPAFEKAYPNIKVQQTVSPYAAMREKVLTLMVVKSPDFDVIFFPESFSVELMSAEWLEPLDGYLRDSRLTAGDPNPSDFFPASKTMTSWQGKQYGLYLSNQVLVLMYNKQMFQEAGLDPSRPPETWDEYHDMAKRISDYYKAHGQERWGTASAFKQHNAIISDEFMPRFASLGDRDLLTPDRKHAAFANDTGMKALEWMRSAMAGSPPGTITYTWNEKAQAFSQGSVAMQINWSSYGLQAENPKSSKVAGMIGYAAVPAAARGGKHISVASGWSVGINSFSQHKREAFQFIQWLTSAQTQQTFNEYAAPTRRSVYTRDLLDKNPVYRGIFLNAQDAVPSMVRVPQAKELNDQLMLWLAQTLAGEAPPRQALERAAKEWEKILAK